MRYSNEKINSSNTNNKSHISDNVQIIDKLYLEYKFQSINNENNEQILNIINNFKLNEEQERAFRIISNHISNNFLFKLRMYIGGMGGTGKSQVLKAIMELFKQRNELYRFLVVAPTGNAAALIQGSTYHSAFGINDITEATMTNLANVKSNIQGVEYIFLDEVSMLSCHDLYMPLELPYMRWVVSVVCLQYLLFAPRPTQQ